MTRGLRTAITLIVLAGLLVVGAAWGWNNMTKPLPGKADQRPCVTTTVPEGELVYPRQVTVSVLNAGGRNGLARRVMSAFTEQGFGSGDSANAPDGTDDIRVARIWTNEPRNPAVLLVKSRLPKGTPIVEREAPGFGVTVVVGDGFEELRKGRKKVKAKSDVEICSPPVQ